LAPLPSGGFFLGFFGKKKIQRKGQNSQKPPFPASAWAPGAIAAVEPRPERTASNEPTAAKTLRSRPVGGLCDPRPLSCPPFVSAWPVVEKPACKARKMAFSDPAGNRRSGGTTWEARPNKPPPVLHAQDRTGGALVGTPSSGRPSGARADQRPRPAALKLLVERVPLPGVCSSRWPLQCRWLAGPGPCARPARRRPPVRENHQTPPPPARGHRRRGGEWPGKPAPRLRDSRISFQFHPDRLDAGGRSPTSDL